MNFKKFNLILIYFFLLFFKQNPFCLKSFQISFECTTLIWHMHEHIIHELMRLVRLHSPFQRNSVFAKNSDFQIPISFWPNVLDLIYFKLGILLDQSLKYQRKFEFVAETEFLLYCHWFKYFDIITVFFQILIQPLSTKFS